MGIINSVKRLTKEICVYKKAEFEIGVDADFNNGFDFDEIALDIEFTAKSGKTYRHPAFLYKQYKPDQNGQYTITDDSAPVWRARISPMEEGLHAAKMVLCEKGEVTDTYEFSFCAVANSDNRGFIGVEPIAKKSFVFANGEIFTPIGQNVCWGDKINWKECSSPETLEMHKRILKKMHKYKANWTRFWISATWDTGFFNLNKNDRTDDFSGAFDRASRIDDYIDILEENDMYACFVFFHHGMFNIGGANCDWHNNAFSDKSKHGYLTDAGDFFKNPRAIKDAKQYARYISARYGYSKNIFCWQHFNEVNFCDGDLDDIYEWHRIMTDFLRKNDAHGHMVTTSSGQNRYTLCFDPMFDFVAFHRYGRCQNVKLIAHEAYLSAPYCDRPIMIEESGDNAYGIAVQPITLHQNLWVGIMGNTPATAMEWFWDERDRLGEKYDDPDYSYRGFKPIAEFAARIPRADKKQRFVSYERIAFNHKNADVLGYCGEDYTYLWFYDKDYRADNPEVREIDSGTFELMIDNGKYKFEWIDTYTGEVLLTETVMSKGKQIKHKTPVFTRDIALAVEKL